MRSGFRIGHFRRKRDAVLYATITITRANEKEQPKETRKCVGAEKENRGWWVGAKPKAEPRGTKIDKCPSSDQFVHPDTISSLILRPKEELLVRRFFFTALV